MGKNRYHFFDLLNVITVIDNGVNV